MEPMWRWLAGMDHNGNPSEMNVTMLDEWLTYTRADYYYPCVEAGLNLLDSHDTPRFLTVLDGDVRKLKVAAIFQMTYIGAPMIYYGDEIGIEGGKDPDCRRTFNWNEQEWNNDLRDHYKKLISIRNDFNALRTGSFETLQMDDQKNLYAYSRYDEKDKFIVLLNGGEEEQHIFLPVWKLDLSENCLLTDLLSGDEYSVEEGFIEVTVNGIDGLLIKEIK